MADKDFIARSVPRLRGGWNVGPDEYAEMGYTSGLPPGFICPSSNSIRSVSNVMEASGLRGDYPETPVESEFAGRTLFVWKFSQEGTQIGLVSFLVQQLSTRGLYSSPGVTPEIRTYPSNNTWAIIFPKESDAANVLAINSEITFLNNPIDIRPIHRPNERSIPPFYLFDDHPQRVIITNVDADKMAEFPAFLEQFFGVDGFLSVKTMPDCCLVDVRPPVSPEAAALLINDQTFGEYSLSARAFRSSFKREEPDVKGKFNVPCDGIDLHQILQRRITITTGADSVDFAGKYLHILNCVPFRYIDDEAQASMISYDIAAECGHFGNVKTCTLSKDPNVGAICGFGVAIVEFEDQTGAATAQEHLSGRKYLGRSAITIVTD